MRKLHCLLVSISFLLFFSQARASHVAGGEIYYQWISGYTYKVTVAIYGDCSSSVYTYLDSSRLSLNIYNGSTLYKTDTFLLQSITALATTCEADTSNVTCHGGTFLGLSAFIFSKDITLPGPSSNWEFNFYGDLGAASAQWVDVANLNAGDLFGLIATLDNSAYTSSSAVFSAPPLFAWNTYQPVSYWSSPYDADGDSLSTVLTDDISGTTPATYKPGYSGVYPVYAMNLNMDSVHGILCFDPIAVQRPAIAEQIRKYRHGTLIGTVMRAWAMTIGNTAVNALTAKIGKTSHSVVTLDTTYAQVYKDTGSISYDVVCNNPNSNNVTMEAYDLPPHTIFTVTGNGTKHPVGNIVWKTDSIATGTYNFLVKVMDDGCPYPASYTQVFRTIVKNSTGITDIKANTTATVYPNPAGKYIKLKGIKTNKFNLTILRSDGAIVKTIHNCHADNAFDIAFLQPGIYCLIAQDEKGNELVKSSFVKE